MDHGKTAAFSPPWRVSVDVGGTFTDLMLCDSKGTLTVCKVPSVPEDPAEGVVHAVKVAAGKAGAGIDDFLGKCTHFVHGSTIATNTLLEGKGARVGLLTTFGFRDSLEIRRGIRDDPWDHRTPFPEVLVPRRLRIGIRGRIDSNGNITEALNLGDLEAAIAGFAAEGIDSVAVCFINSFRNPTHELECGEFLRRQGDFKWLTLSSQVAAIIGEYERTSTAVANAYIAPRVVSYVRALEDRLKRLGLTQKLMLIQSNGGVANVDQVVERPISLAMSGPAAGSGALQVVAAATKNRDLLLMEIGGTSCDVTLMDEGNVAFTEHLNIGPHHLATPAVEVHSVGAGGGTIAGVDVGGMLFVGPKGAGARPGPACYGLGGTEPTITDALIVLGRLRPGSYADGNLNLKVELAAEAINKISASIDVTDVEAAAGIIRVLEQHLLHAVEKLSVERGYDPRKFALVPAGGAGPMHGASVARLLGCKSAYISRYAGAFCALGMLNADLRYDISQFYNATLLDENIPKLALLLKELEAQAYKLLAEHGFGSSASKVVGEVKLRYRGQQWSIPVPVDGPLDRVSCGQLRRGFEAIHQRFYGHTQPSAPIDITGVGVAGFGLIPGLATPEEKAIPKAPAKPSSVRDVYDVYGMKWERVPIYDGARLEPGHRIEGPLVIEDATTTVFAGRGDVVTVDGSRNYMIEIGDR
ncbi:MAG: hydantoinase/oxoprolinase family protein [Reyranellaceae bacterium]